MISCYRKFSISLILLVFQSLCSYQTTEYKSQQFSLDGSEKGIFISVGNFGWWEQQQNIPGLPSKIFLGVNCGKQQKEGCLRRERVKTKLDLPLLVMVLEKRNSIMSSASIK